MATTVKSGRGWKAYWEMGRDASGKRKQGTKAGFRLKKSPPGTDVDALIRSGDLARVGALDYAQYQERALAGGTYVKPLKDSVRTYLERWLRDYAEPGLRPRTVEGYSYICARYIYPLLGSAELQKLSPAIIQAAYAKLSAGGWKDGKVQRAAVSPRTVLHAHRVLKEALSWAVKWSLLSRNPTDVVAPPRPERKELGRLTPDECLRILTEAKGTVLEPIIHLGLFTGMRRGEVLGLTWANVDLGAGTIAVIQTLQRVHGKGLVTLPPKTEHSRRNVALSAETVAALKSHRIHQAEQRLAAGPGWKDGAWVFTGEDGGPLNPDYVTHGFRRIARAVGVKGRYHDLRHAHASFLLAQGVHAKIVSERLGHATISITLDTYSHVLPTLQEKAAEAFDEAMRKARVVSG